jgi:hypothetical protein
MIYYGHHQRFLAPQDLKLTGLDTRRETPVQYAISCITPDPDMRGRQNGDRATAEALAENMAMTIGAESGAATGPIPVEAQDPEALRLNSPEQANFSVSSWQTIAE